MHKDVIYIDVEDDITSIISKVKESSAKIVALVPPKRVGVLQSSVNLRLLARAAEKANKRIVLVTADSALAGLAASASILIAKTLQSKPELAEIPALEVSDDSNIIDGANFADVDIDKAKKTNIAAEDLPSSDKIAPKKENENSSKKLKAPNFNKARKKIIIIAGASLLVVGFLIWAIFFAARAEIIITAKTSLQEFNSTVMLSSMTNTEKNSLKSETQELKKELSAEVIATGKKKVGEKAKGSVKFSTGSIALLGKTVPAGTILTSTGGKTYTTDAAVTFTLSNYSGVSVAVTASAIGEEYNGASGTVSGASAGVSAAFSGTTSGGSSKEVSIVTQADVQKASEGLLDKNNDDIKKELIGRFSKEYVVIAESFDSRGSEPKISPAVGDEAPDGKAKLETTATYRIIAVDKSEIEKFLKQVFEKEANSTKGQKVYNNGLEKAQLIGFKSGDSATATLRAEGVIGPDIDEAQVKRDSAGHRYGEVQSRIKKIKGVDSVDIKFSPFWVSTVPDKPERVTISFNLDNGKKD